LLRRQEDRYGPAVDLSQRLELAVVVVMHPDVGQYDQLLPGVGGG